MFITFQCAITINHFEFWSFLSKMPKAIALLFGQKCLIVITFNVQSKWINFNFGHLSAKYQGHSLTSGPKMAHCHHFSMCNHNQSISILVIFEQNTKGYSLTFWPKKASFSSLSMCNQNQSISILVMFRQNTKVIALLFGQKCLMFITFQCAIKINHILILSCFSKISRLQPYFLGKNASISSLSMCNQNQSISILVMFRQNTKVIALRFGQKCLIFITFQCAIKINQILILSFFSKISRL